MPRGRISLDFAHKKINLKQSIKICHISTCEAFWQFPLYKTALLWLENQSTTKMWLRWNFSYVNADSIGEYISQGASSVVLSDAIFNKKALDQLNFDTIYELAHLAALRGNEAIQRSGLVLYVAFIICALCWSSRTFL